ncbi:MAG: fibronectin type III domain-containing protein, partial [Bacteroidales bacterium]|nr:fibronectin type III domain-containing protein [Bacteroidales bacterium]
MKKILLATLAILWLLTGIGGRLVAQENIAVWKFPSNNTAVTCVSDAISESDCGFSSVGNVNTAGTNSPNTLLCDGTDDTKSLQVLGQDGGSVIFKISTLPYRNIVVSYDLRCHPSLGGNPNYAWSYSFDGVSYTNAPALTAVTNFTATTFTTQTADFSSITAMNGKQSVWFKLTMSGATSNVTSNLDNVVFTGIPFTCMAPVNVVAAQNDAVDEAVVSWEPAGTNETSYTVVYYTGSVNQSALSSMASANYNTVANAVSPQTITGLEANTTYYIYVRANCGGTDESMWSQAAIVTTPTRCTIADLGVSNIGGTTATLSWNTEAAGARVRVFSAPTDTPWETSTGLVFEQSVADTFCNVTGMQYSTNYYAYVRSACTERNLSEPISTTFTTAFADNVIEATIGEAETSGYYAPFNNFYRNSWNQSIYTVNEIGHAGTIGTVSWYSASTSTVHFTDLRIYMGLTSMSEASATSSWVPMDDLTLVYSSTDYTVGGNVGWETFYLDTPYEYDGSQNLVVVVAKKTANYSSSCTYRYTAVTNRVLYRQSDSDESYASHPGTATGTRSNNLP